MELVNDDISNYHKWQSIVANNQFLADIGSNKKQTSNPTKDAKLLSRRLSKVPAIVAGNSVAIMEPSDTRQYKVPDNREVELIVKWREVTSADTELHKIRAVHKKMIEQYAERWQAIERGQRDLKQNLVKFNNFVK